MTTLTKVFIVTLILAVLMAHPLTRRIALIILPLGRGFDDILFWIFFVIFILVAFVKGWVSLPKFISKIEREEK